MLQKISPTSHLKTYNENPMIIIKIAKIKMQTLGRKKGSHINSMKFSFRLF